MTLHAGRRTPRMLESLATGPRTPSAADRPGAGTAGTRRLVDPSSRRPVAGERRTTRLLATGLW